MSLQELERREAIRGMVAARAASRAVGNRLNTSLNVYLQDKHPVGGFGGIIDDIPLKPDKKLEGLEGAGMCGCQEEEEGEVRGGILPFLIPALIGVAKAAPIFAAAAAAPKVLSMATGNRRII